MWQACKAIFKVANWFGLYDGLTAWFLRGLVESRIANCDAEFQTRRGFW
jgi:hypothetical protein